MVRKCGRNEERAPFLLSQKLPFCHKEFCFSNLFLAHVCNRRETMKKFYHLYRKRIFTILLLNVFENIQKSLCTTAILGREFRRRNGKIIRKNQKRKQECQNFITKNQRENISKIFNKYSKRVRKKFVSKKWSRTISISDLGEHQNAIN